MQGGWDPPWAENAKRHCFLPRPRTDVAACTAQPFLQKWSGRATAFVCRGSREPNQGSPASQLTLLPHMIPGHVALEEVLGGGHTERAFPGGPFPAPARMQWLSLPTWD